MNCKADSPVGIDGDVTIFKNILVVCIGNICRSPSAQIIMQCKAPSLNITSAGLSAVKGHGIDALANGQLVDAGYENDGHSAVLINDKMVRDADLVLVMELAQQQQLMRDYPASSGKIMLLGKWMGNTEINDPYGKSAEAFASVFVQIERASELWVERLT